MSSIDGSTRLVGLMGWPVEHSLSPTMHNAAFDALGLNWRYVPLPVPPGQVDRAVRGLTALGFRGVNVTVPHKEAVANGLDLIAPDAETLGAVNTIVVEWDGKGQPELRGHNTDHSGFVVALRRGGFEPEGGAKAVVVGAGGAARAVVFGLLRSGIEEVEILNRSPERAEGLVADLAEQDDWEGKLSASALTVEVLIQSTRRSDLLVNATPVGMEPREQESIWPADVPIPPRLTVFDLVYNPLETRLVRWARRCGARAIDGLGMLLSQGAAAFQMWTGEKAPLDVMRAACERALRLRR